MTASRSIPNISTQSIQRPTPGNVRSVPGVPHLNPTASLPQSPVKFSPQTGPKSTAMPPVWGARESQNEFNSTGYSKFNESTVTIDVFYDRVHKRNVVYLFLKVKLMRSICSILYYHLSAMIKY